MVYTPNPVQQNDWHPLRWLNCTCASAATALDRDTKGIQETSSGRVRDLTRDTIGGTNLDQVDSALRSGFGPADHLDNRRALPFDDAVDEVASGRGAIAQGGYDGGFAGTDLDGSPGFTGNHAIYWNAVTVVRTEFDDIDYEDSRAQVYDPLWDGRRSGIPSREFRWIKLITLRNFCGRLKLSSGNRLGAGRGYFAFTRDTETEPKPPPVVKIEFGSNMAIDNSGLEIISSHKMTLKQGQSIYLEAKVGAKVIARMSKAGPVDYHGNAGPGWKAIRITTGGRKKYAYVPASAGPVTSKE